ncbi:hypothetical protein RI129_009013 [Pyrocoelia pectoralis]|uniref:CRAL-TRIO domain-containing protein n=1 Tax=Pyrocoelia pectoralis TaxID=417401 RepID=A0AAN7ZLN0_9COLE
MDIRPLKHELQEKAIRELNEDTGRIQEAFDHIRDWLQKQPHLNVRKDNQTMIAFFRGCKWNLQAVKQKLDYFYSNKNRIPDFYKDRNPLSPEIQKVLKAGLVVPLPKVENYFGPVLIFYNFKNVDVSETPFVEVAKVLFMTLDILLNEDDDTVVSGASFIVEYDQCPLSYFLQYTPTVMKNYFRCLQNAYPIRIKDVVAINSPSVLESVYNAVCKPFMTTKLRERFNLEKWKTKVESYTEWFIEDAKYVSNEKLRIGDTMSFEIDAGIDGTFRNLIID